MPFEANKPESGVTTFGQLYAVIRGNDVALACHHAGASAPSSPAPGWVWYDTANKRFKAWDSDTSTWVELGTKITGLAEVTAARGSAATLSDYLTVGHNPDGSHKAAINGGDQYINPGTAPTYVNATQFTVSGDHRDIYCVNRRVRATLTGGDVFGTVYSSSYSAPNTTVTLHEITDAAGTPASLDATLSLAEVGFIFRGKAGAAPRMPFLDPVSALSNLPSSNVIDGDTVAVTGKDSLYLYDATDSAWVPVGRTGLAPIATATPGMTIKVHEGLAIINGVVVELTSATASPTVTAPTVNPRIDVLTIDYAGALAWVTGAESATPTAPSIPADKMPVCEIYLRTGTTAIHNTDQGSHGYIKRDIRPHLRHVPMAPAIANIREVVVAPNATNPNYQVDVSLKFECYGVTKTYSATLDLTATGAGGRDLAAVAEAANAWYEIHLIVKPDGTVSSVFKRFTIKGTNTSASANKLVDSGATFSTNLVAVGDVVRNLTDNTTAEVTAVDSETQLSLSADIFAASSKSYSVALSRTPTLPAGYLAASRYSFGYNDGSSNLLAFYQAKEEWNYDTPPADASSLALTTTWDTVPLSVPPNTRRALVTTVGINNNASSHYYGYMRTKGSSSSTGRILGRWWTGLYGTNTSSQMTDKYGRVEVKGEATNINLTVYTCGFRIEM